MVIKVNMVILVIMVIMVIIVIMVIMVSSITRVTLVKSPKGVLAHQGHIIKVSANAYSLSHSLLV